MSSTTPTTRKRWTESDVERSRARSQELGEMAKLKGPKMSDEWMAESAFLKLIDLSLNLPHCYDVWLDSMYDWWPDLAWNHEQQNKQVNIILADPRLPLVCQRIKAKHNYDMMAELKASFEDE